MNGNLLKEQKLNVSHKAVEGKGVKTQQEAGQEFKGNRNPGKYKVQQRQVEVNEKSTIVNCNRKNNRKKIIEKTIVKVQKHQFKTFSCWEKMIQLCAVQKYT